ncbi:MAG TPA: PAS domain-containing sensor histidine kinase [Streptosporangiaceae bacterium]|jgi:PAS domain S-box-containing protein|nr:PAS domain-containing sensor histidine kinase [Streptosporangiaceae bacterium]
MGVSRAASQAATPSDGQASPFELLEFAVSQAVSQEGAAPDAGLPELLRRCLAGFGGRAALALRLLAPGEPAVIAAYPHAAVDPGLMVQITALLDGHPEVTSAGGCVQGRVTWPGPEAVRNPDGVLIAVARLPGYPCPCALILVAQRSRWPAEWQATARALATVIAARIRRAEDTREIAERRAVTDALIAASPDAVVVADAARKIVAFNPAAERLYGRRRADVIGQGMGDLLIPERNRARFMTSTEEFLRSQDPGEYTGRMHLPILRGDGSERTVELTPLPLVVGGQTYFCNFARDVTELERANTALAASEARVRLLSELAPVGIARTDGTGTCAYVNERWCALNGQLAEAILGTSWLESVHPGDLPRVRREWVRARAAGSELRTDFRLRRHAGEPLWVHAAVTSLADQADLPRGFMVALTNVTARKRAEQERDRLLVTEQAAVRDLTDQTERLNALLAAAIPGVLVLDENSLIVQANQSLCDLLGIEEAPAKLTGLSAGQLRGPAGRTFTEPAEVLDRVAGYYTRREQVEGLRFPCADGRMLECDYWPVSAGGQDRGGLVLLWDMSERAAQERERDRRLEAELASRHAAEDARQELSEQNAELRELDELKTRFLATVSHELRSPLTSIVSYAELIRDEDRLSPAAARFLDVISRNAERITKLVGDLLLLSRIEAGMIPLELTQVFVAEVVTEAVQAAAPGAAQQGVTLDGSAPAGPPVLADRARLVQVIDNLIANAVKFTDEGGQVRVTASVLDREWRIDVRDSGIGIPPAEIGHLFDRFFRASNATTAGRPGSGLGLSIVKEVAELHGGRVEVSSTLGAGTTVHLFLPAHPAVAPAEGGTGVTADV